MRIEMSGLVYDDYLDPRATGIPKELGLPKPNVVRRGRGYTMIYDVTVDQAREVADYFRDRAETLWGDDVELRHIHRAALKVADRIAAALREGK